MIPVEVISQGGAWGLLAGVVTAIVTGKLVPRRTLLDVKEERDLWRATAERAMQQNQQLLTGARVAQDVIRVLPEATAGERS